MAVDHLLKNDGGRFLLNNGTSHLILNTSTSSEDDTGTGAPRGSQARVVVMYQRALRRRNRRRRGRR